MAGNKPQQDGASAPSFASDAWPDDLIQVGHILDAWGIKGWFKVQAYSQQADALFTAKRWFLKSTGPKAARRELKIASVREHGEGIVAFADDVPDRNAAEALKGFELFISRSDFPKAGDGEYYWVDLIGLEVLNRESQPLGRVVGLIDTGPHCVLRIVPPGLIEPVKPDQERLIPFVDAFVDEVDMPARQIRVDWGVDY
ncbi:MAG: ribosome maturation factor RimM [Roseateles depolymerans]|uniref:Ribosome maturation factor RimM n=1 Tax=Roseateles depolymerans TaxID=76731 RepID=A0A2W5DBE8_9BURK|nr:MAG: ribosome maturation factor RimM [Roseateles depolymerans]